MADSQAGGLSPAEVYAPPQRRGGSRVPALVWLALVIAAAVGGCYVGHEVLRDPVDFGVLAGRTTLAEDELDDAVATYELAGEPHAVSAREALAQQGSLEAAKRSDGSYAMPAAESVLAAARTAVLMGEVESRGITVSDEELASYLDETFGTQDVASLASAYAMDEETARARLGESAAIAKLRREVVEAPGDVPAEPPVPEAGKEDEPSDAYAAYIIGLAGEEWDVEHDCWADGEGPYATALHDFDVSAEGATYAAASCAFDVAYQLYGAKMTAADTQWTDFVNARLSQAKLALCTLGT